MKGSAYQVVFAMLALADWPCRKFGTSQKLVLIQLKMKIYGIRGDF
jgi:hypothetical protein